MRQLITATVAVEMSVIVLLAIANIQIATAMPPMQLPDGLMASIRERLTAVETVPTPFSNDDEFNAPLVAPLRVQIVATTTTTSSPITSTTTSAVNDATANDGQAPSSSPPKQQFPWPYPPQFESYLPVLAKQQLFTVYLDKTLTPEQRAQKVNNVFDSLPLETIARLPLPVGYERLPANVYSRIMYVHTAPTFRWAERQELIHEIIDSLPEEQKRQMSTRLEGPPPGFELVLAPTVYKQLLAVHYNRQLTKAQRADTITRIMRQVPQEQLERLPMPAGMDQLPNEIKGRLHSLVYDYTVPQRIRAQRVHQYVASLPDEYRPPLGPR